MKKEYKTAIHAKNLDKIFEIFRNDLNAFLLKTDNIFEEYIECKPSEYTHLKKLRMEWVRTWAEFIHSTPFVFNKKDRSGTLRLSQLIPKDKLLSGEEEGIETFYIDVIRTLTQIILEKQWRHKEVIISCCLSAIASSIDLSNMTIRPRTIVSKVEQVYKEVLNGTFKAPQQTTVYHGKIYENQNLSSSRKGYINREEKLTAIIDEYITTYKLMFKSLPTRAEIRDHIIAQCKNEPTLRIFRDGINPKTLSKILKLYEPQISRRRKSVNGPVENATVRLSKKTILCIAQKIIENEIKNTKGL